MLSSKSAEIDDSQGENDSNPNDSSSRRDSCAQGVNGSRGHRHHSGGADENGGDGRAVSINAAAGNAKHSKEAT